MSSAIFKTSAPATAVLVLLVTSGALACGPGSREEPSDDASAVAVSALDEIRPRQETVPAAGPVGLTYVPVYSHIYHQADDTFQLAATLSIRNTDPETPVTVRAVRYHDTQGRLVREHLPQPRPVPPLGSLEFVVDEADTSGGSGASFLVSWSAERPVSEPVIESVMISTRLGQGISFTSRGVPVDRPEGTR